MPTAKPRAPRQRPHLIVTIPRALRERVSARAAALDWTLSAVTEHAFQVYFREIGVEGEDDEPQADQPG